MKINTYHLFFKRLSNPLRIQIVSCLKEKPCSVGEIVKKLKVEQSKISHALNELRKCNIVYFKVSGKERVYYLYPTINSVLRSIDKHSRKICKNCEFRRSCNG